jgi:hypothetical protein
MRTPIPNGATVTQLNRGRSADVLRKRAGRTGARGRSPRESHLVSPCLSRRSRRIRVRGVLRAEEVTAAWSCRTRTSSPNWKRVASCFGRTWTMRRVARMRQDRPGRRRGTRRLRQRPGAPWRHAGPPRPGRLSANGCGRLGGQTRREAGRRTQESRPEGRPQEVADRRQSDGAGHRTRGGSGRVLNTVCRSPVVCEQRLSSRQEGGPVGKDGQPCGLLALGDNHEEPLPIGGHVVLIPNSVDPEA